MIDIFSCDVFVFYFLMDEFVEGYVFMKELLDKFFKLYIVNVSDCKYDLFVVLICSKDLVGFLKIFIVIVEFDLFRD